MHSARHFSPSIPRRFPSISLTILIVTGCQGLATSSNPSISSPATSGSHFVYVTVNPTCNVVGLRIDGSGALSEVGGSPFAASDCAGSIARNQDFIFVGSTYRLNGPPFPTEFPILTYAQNPATGSLSQVASLKTNAVGSLAVDPRGKFLYAGTGDGFSVFSIGAEGQLTEIAGSPFHMMGDGGWQIVHPNGRFLYALIMGRDGALDFVTVGSLDPATGAILARIFVGPPADAFVITPDARFLIAINSLVNEICIYPLDPNTGTLGIVSNGRLTPWSRAPTGALPSKLAIHPDGTFVAVTNQLFDGFNGSVSVFRLLDGTFTEVAGSPFRSGHVPRFVTFTADGKFVLVADQPNYPLNLEASDDIMVFQLDATSGALTLAPGSPLRFEGVPEQILAH